ncbi:MAG: molybdenum cofactor guanylyltransferase MobA [Pseudomonadota bacterium]
MSRHSTTGAVILAGGLARRMGGGDKPLLVLSGRTMLDRVAERIGAQVSSVILNANGDPTRFASNGLPVTPDGIPGNAGPLAGILAGLEYFRDHEPGIDAMVSIAGDTPFFPDDLVETLLGAQRHSGIALAQSGDRVHPVFGLWPVALAEDLRYFLTVEDNRKVLAFVDRHPNARVSFPMANLGAESIDPFFNVNTPEDLAKAETILAAREELPV